MIKERDFLTNLMNGINFPDEAKEIFLHLDEQIYKNSIFSDRMDGIILKFMNNQIPDAFHEVDNLSIEMNVHSYTMSMLLLLLSAKPLKERYKKKGVAEDIYWDTLKDLTYKLNECYQLHSIWGVFVRHWFPSYYQMTRFALGRMQYEYSTFQLESYERNGITLRKGDKVINMHIPSSGSFNKEVRLNSYKRAYAFYKKDFVGKPIPFVCSSWLLYPEYKQLLPNRLNIRGFMDDFSFIRGETADKFHDAWRVFGKDFDKAPKDLPRNTTLQRLFAQHLENGGHSGSGYGVFLFDGEKILQ